MSLIALKGSRPKAFATRLPMSWSISGAERVWPGRTLRKGFIGQYHFLVEQKNRHEKRELLDWGERVP